jgi:ATP-binding cassette, subfamily C, bacterial CydD
MLRRLDGARTALAADATFGLLATVALLAQATLFAHVVAAAFRGSPLRALVPALALLGAVVLARSVLAFAFEATGRRAAARVMSGLRLELVERRLREPFAADGAEAAEVATAAVQGIDALEGYFARYLPQVVLAVLVPAVVLVWTAAVDRTSALIMLATLPLIPVFMILIGRTTQARTRARWRALARLSNHFLDVVRGLPTLRAFNRAEPQTDRIEAASEAFRATTMEVLRVSFLSGAVLELMATIATALVAVTLGIRLVEGGVGLEAALVVLLLTPELYAPLRSLAAQYHASADGLAAAERILGLLDAVTPSECGRRDAVPEAWEAIRLESVTVRYPGRNDPALDGFELELRRGATVALVGPSGAGKSTVASLLLALRAPDEGRVTIGERDLARVDPAEWRRQVAWLPQRPTIVRGTIAENIALGDPGASIERILGAARLAGADDFVREFRLGYDTRVGEGGRPLSAGESRRVALARALLRDAPLLILDEPTANLDADSAWTVADAIRLAAPERAFLLIEHRMDVALGLADRVIGLEGGRAAPVDRELVASARRGRSGRCFGWDGHRDRAWRPPSGLGPSPCSPGWG